MSTFEKIYSAKMWLMSTFENENLKIIFFVSTFLDWYNNLEPCKKERDRRGKGARKQVGRIAEKDGKLCRKCNITLENTGENHVKTSEKGCCFFWVG